MTAARLAALNDLDAQAAADLTGARTDLDQLGAAITEGCWPTTTKENQ